MSTLVRIRDLSVDFTSAGETVRAVSGVSFDIERGKTMALVGESGSGKSVTALSILQLLPYPVASHPSGTIDVDGTEVIGASPRRLRQIRGNRISMIFQEPMTSLNPLHTIGRQVAEVLTLHRGLPKRQRAHPRAGAAGDGGAGRDRQAAQGVPARAFGRAAPAGDDRHGARLRARPADRGRAHHRPRRHGPGADPEAAWASCSSASAWRCC